MSSISTNFIYFSVLCSALFALAHAAQFEIRNQCPYTVWAAAIPGGGKQLNTGQSWTINVNATPTRIWGRTNCTFNTTGHGRCQTGDCNGLLQCQGYGQPPQTLAEFGSLNNLDIYDISLVDGFNVPMDLTPTSAGCRSAKCSSDINGQCPNELRAPGGCNNPCTVFKTNEYCCYSGPCGPTNYSRFFKSRCPDAFSSPRDDSASPFTCPSASGSNYRVLFCP